MPPRVTVAIPTRSRQAWLREAVASALAQTWTDLEVLVSDDAAEEAVRAWVEGMREPRLRYRSNPRPLGLAGNWNAAADDARGEFLAIMGDDDRLLPRFVEALAAAAADVAFADHYLIDEKGARLEAASRETTRRFGRDRLPAGPLKDPAAWVWRNAVPIPCLMRAAMARRLRFKEDLNNPEIELFARLADEGGGFVFVPEYLAEYRVHPASATATGLRSERLAEHLIPLAVPPEVEPAKREFLAGLLKDAVGRCLRQGDAAGARRLLASAYYPREAGLRGLLQRGCAKAPLGCGAYRLIHALAAAFR